MEGEGGRVVVCVTGASGFIASWLVKILLQRGYTVRASLRNPTKTRLRLFQADLLEEGSFDRIVDGCQGVFHTAGPVKFSAQDPQAELIDPAVKGTLNVMKSCAKASSVKRVVLTSSEAAVAFNERMLIPGVLFDESSFSDQSFCEKSKHWYPLSKTLAEEAAWKYAKDHRIDMVSICPGWVIGPILQPTVNATVDLVLNLINGSESFPDVSYTWVDVRDVADAHIRAFEDSSASGRYCVADRLVHFSEVVKILHKIYPEIDIPERCEEVSPLLKFQYRVDNTKAKGLGIVFTSLEESLKDTVARLIEKKFHITGLHY